MNLDELKEKIQLIVNECSKLKNLYTDEKNALVNYVCIFAHSENEFDLLTKVTIEFGTIIKETPTGFIYKISPISTVSGKLKLLKIRKPFENKPELGYSDFTLNDYPNFKKKFLSKKGFRLIERENYEMIEIKDSSFDVLTYFAYPPLNEQLNVK